MPDPSLHIVRPFGTAGRAYEVDAAGIRKYRLAWTVAGAVVIGWMLRGLLGVPAWLTVALSVAGLAVTLALCADVARKGRKI